MVVPKRQHAAARAASAHLNELLDEALKQTFPASDPVAIDVESSRMREDSGSQAESAAEACGER